VLDGCALALRRTSRGADALASRVGVVLGGSATGTDRELAAELRRLAASTYQAAAALELARSR
jgi:hypothetical protein